MKILFFTEINAVLFTTYEYVFLNNTLRFTFWKNACVLNSFIIIYIFTCNSYIVFDSKWKISILCLQENVYFFVNRKQTLHITFSKHEHPIPLQVFTFLLISFQKKNHLYRYSKSLVVSNITHFNSNSPLFISRTKV